MGRKKEKHGKIKEGKVTKKNVSLIQFDIENPHQFRDKLYVVQTEKYNWTSHFYRGRLLDEDYLVCDIYCHSHHPSWSSDNRIDIRIYNRQIHVVDCHFQLKRNCMSIPSFLRWKSFVKPENRYVRDGKAFVQIYISEVSKTLIRNPSNFEAEYPGINNLQVNVGKSKFFTNKELLACTSKFFERERASGIMCTEFPYTIYDCTAIDFKLYMDLVYHPKQYFSAYHAKDILQLARRFENAEIVQACQNCIVEDLNENKLSAKEKAKLTEAYDMETVKELFNPDILRPNTRPRFMPAEYYAIDDSTTPHIEQDGNNICVTLSQNIPVELEEQPPLLEEVPLSLEPTSSSGSSDSFDYFPKIGYEEEDVIWISDSEDEKEQGPKEVEEEEEEEFDISIPSTSGLTNY